MWFFSTLPPAPLIGHELCPSPLPANADGVWLGVVHLRPGWSCLLLQPLQAWVRTSQGFFTYQKKKKKRWKEGGKTNFYFLFGSSGKAEGQGTVGEGGASLCLNYYAKKQNKQTKKQLALYTVEGRPSPRLTVFPWSWEAKAWAVSLAASQGEH